VSVSGPGKKLLVHFGGKKSTESVVAYETRGCIVKLFFAGDEQDSYWICGPQDVSEPLRAEPRGGEAGPFLRAECTRCQEEAVPL